MTDATPRVHSSAAEVTRALLDLRPGSDKFSITTDRDGRVLASWFLADMGATQKSEVYRITLLGETGEYKSWLYELEEPSVQASASIFVTSSYSYSFNSKDLTGPVDEVLAAHGWVPARSGASKFFGRLFGRS
jgi:hypothetical protein